MTKEELKKEAEEKAGIYFDNLDYDHDNVSDTPFSSYDVFIAYKKGALDFAEPREKQIAELEKENAELKKELVEKGQHLDLTEKEWGKDLVQMYHFKTLYTKQTDQLTKAKELLKQWLQTSKASGCDNINIVADTEQFLNSELEK